MLSPFWFNCVLSGILILDIVWLQHLLNLVAGMDLLDSSTKYAGDLPFIIAEYIQNRLRYSSFDSGLNALFDECIIVKASVRAV